MAIEWKKSKKFKPDIILKKIGSVATVSSDGKVSFSGFEFHEAIAVLRTMIQFPEELPWVGREIILPKAISEALKKGELDKKSVLEELNAQFKNQLAQKAQKYYLLTSISISPPLLGRTVNIGSCNIKLFESNYPRKFHGRNELISDLQSRDFAKGVEANPRGYSRVVVSIKAKSADSAANECLKALDTLRAVWCLMFNSSMEFVGDEWSPINKIRLGGVHTIHHEDGALATDTFWFEPNFVYSSPHQVSLSSIDKSRKYFRQFWRLIEESKYSNALRKSLIRYVRSLDERDQNSALIKLWGAMEELLSPFDANYDLVTRRCSFLFQDRDYHHQSLEHLREYRNSSIHVGEQGERTKTLCFQLQFYFYRVIGFHLSNTKCFDSLEQANEFLDLPPDVVMLKRRRMLIDKATKFLGGDKK
jgi:hypothetical protein